MSGSAPHFDQLRLRQLRLLDLIDRYKSLRAVAGEMNLTQPAVSQMLKDLEYAFGVTLVERSARGVVLSPQGRIALQRVRAGLTIFDHLSADLAAELPRVVRVGTNPAALFQLIPAALRQLDVSRAGVRFRLEAGTVGNMMSRLLDGELDCYVGRIDWSAMPAEMAERLRYEPLTETELVVACSVNHPLAGRSDVAAAELLEWPWALPAGDTNNRRSIETAFRNDGVAAPRPVVEVSADPTSLLILAQEVDLLICVPRVVLQSHISGGRVVPLATPGLFLPPIRICIVTLPEIGELPALRLLRNALIEVCT